MLIGRRPINRFVVWMLVVGAGNPVQHFCIVGVSRPISGHLDQPGVPGDAALIAILIFRWRSIGLVERADKNSHILSIRIVEYQRSTAVAAKAPASDIRTMKITDCPACHSKFGLHDRADDREGAANRLLAHAAVAHMNVLRLLIKRVSNCAALAASSQNMGLHRLPPQDIFAHLVGDAIASGNKSVRQNARGDLTVVRRGGVAVIRERSNGLAGRTTRP